MFCHKCGTEAIEKAIYCLKCGIRLVPAKESEDTSPTQTVKHMFDAREAAEYLHYSYWSVLNKAKEGIIPHVKIGRKILFSQEGLDKWLEEKEAKSMMFAPEPKKQYGVPREIIV